MNTINIICFLSTVAAALAGKWLHPLSDEFIAEINNKQSTWKAGRNFEISQYPLFKKLVSGTKRIENVERVAVRVHDEDADIPESFDSRAAWPECADIIGVIRDQSTCGSSWALAAAETMSDRICIHSNGTRKLLVSSQDVLTCTDYSGCDGGIFEWPWITWSSSGYVTGGLYNNTEQGCRSYFLPPCDNHLNECNDNVETPACVRECDDPSLNYTEHTTFGQSVAAFVSLEQIQLEILKNGPVESLVYLHSDFASYKSGIYQYVKGDLVGGYAVRIVGWGVENGVKYWTVANSWNERWGENGFFRIIRGVNEGGIEDEAVAALPDFTRF